MSQDKLKVMFLLRSLNSLPDSDSHISSSSPENYPISIVPCKDGQHIADFSSSSTVGTDDALGDLLWPQLVRIHEFPGPVLAETCHHHPWPDGTNNCFRKFFRSEVSWYFWSKTETQNILKIKLWQPYMNFRCYGLRKRHTYFRCAFIFI